MNLKKTTLLFDDEVYEKLKEKSKLEKVSIGELVREAVSNYYGIKTMEEKMKALNRLKMLNLPVGEPEVLDKEIEKGYLEEGL